jgi:hypothetical protein
MAQWTTFDDSPVTYAFDFHGHFCQNNREKNTSDDIAFP